MALTTVTTRLSAVNKILRALNEQPVLSLTPPVPADVDMAMATLDEVTLEVLIEGWSFNRECDVELVLDGAFKYAIPADVIRIVLDRPRFNLQLVMRDDAGTLRLYNKAKGQHTFVLPAGLKATLIRIVDFEATPESFRQYVSMRAARQFRDRLQGRAEAAELSREEIMARSTLRQEENDHEPRTLFDSYAAFRVIDRRYPRTRGQA